MITLKSLDLQIIVRNPNKDDLKRVEQMTQRTNQFNLTTKRLNEFDVQSLNKAKIILFIFWRQEINLVIMEFVVYL